jgi:hypothetical protein
MWIFIAVPIASAEYRRCVRSQLPPFSGAEALAGAERHGEA